MDNTENEFLTKDDSVNLSELISLTENEIQISKKEQANNIIEFGNSLIEESNRKQKRNEIIKQKYIKWILKKSTFYDFEELNSYTFQDVRNIRNEILSNKKKPIKDFFYFIFQNP